MMADDFTLAQFKTLFHYHWHTTSRLLDTAATLTPNAYQEHPGYGHGSMHVLFFHILRTLNGWRGGLETGLQSVPLQLEEFPDLAAIRAGLEREQTAWETWFGSTDEQDLQGVMTFTSRRGDAANIPRWRVLQHLILHGMQHHTEIAQLLTAHGASPGDIDFIFYQGT